MPNNASQTEGAKAQAKPQVGVSPGQWGPRRKLKELIRRQYMHLPIIQAYYNDLTKDSLENAVDLMWANVLPLYFTGVEGYGISLQERPWPGVAKTKADLAIRYIKNGQPRKVCLIEDKRVMYESSDGRWQSAVEQLTTYMTVTRASNPNPSETMYGIVTVGRYSRFYELRAGQRKLMDFTYCDGSPLHFKHNELEIDGILCYLVQLTKC